MSRIGKQIIKIPTGVNVQLTETDIKVKGSKGEISRDIPNCLSVVFNKDENTLQILRNSESITSREIHGLFRYWRQGPATTQKDQDCFGVLQ